MVDRPEVNRSVARLDLATYKLFEKKALGTLPVVPEDALQAGMKIGIEYVLRLLREDIVIGA